MAGGGYALGWLTMSGMVLSALTLNRHLARWLKGFPRPLVDLSRTEGVDPFAACFLALYARRCAEAGGQARILLPGSRRAREDLLVSGFFRLVGNPVWIDRPPDGRETEKVSAFAQVVRVTDEGKIQALVDRVCDALADHFPLGETSIRILAEAMLELAQNIPQHANPLRENIDPWGLLVVREYEDHIHLAVMDKGVGLHRSLTLNPRYKDLKEEEALEAVLIQGASRLADPGRGGALRRIREVVLRNEGRLLVRSGGACFWQAEVE